MLADVVDEIIEHSPPPIKLTRVTSVRISTTWGFSLIGFRYNEAVYKDAIRRRLESSPFSGEDHSQFHTGSGAIRSTNLSPIPLHISIYLAAKESKVIWNKLTVSVLLNCLALGSISVTELPVLLLVLDY